MISILERKRTKDWTPGCRRQEIRGRCPVRQGAASEGDYSAGEGGNLEVLLCFLGHGC